LSGSQFATTAEELMRSRYSAFATGHTRYLLDTWHPRTRPLAVQPEIGTVWTRLEVVSATGGGMLDQTGTVEFIAHYREQNTTDSMHGNSTFERVDGKWHYVDEVDG
jgi:SEC-C motif-containing protein